MDQVEQTIRGLVVLSAASEAHLADLAYQLAERIRRSDEVRLEDIASTTQAGRTALPHRLVVACADLDTLVEALDAVVDGRPHPAARLAVVDEPTALEGPVDEARTRPGAAPAEAYLLAHYSEVSGITMDRLSAHTPLAEYGLTSLQITQLNERLAADLGTAVPTTLFFTHPTLAAVAEALTDLRRGPWPTKPAPPPADPAPPPAAGDDKAIAIIGIAGRYPEAPTLPDFWANLCAGRDSVTPLPVERRRDGWPLDVMWGGFIAGVDLFDPFLFGIAPSIARRMDPQERVFLEVAWETLEDAGYPRDRLRERHGSRVGVYVGAMYNDYPFYGVERTALGTPDDSGNTPGDIANRVSFAFDLVGPSLTLDTMCSSALTAIHLAVRALRHGECELALAGAANLSVHPNKFRQLHRMTGLSTDRRCRSFGAGGDGMVPSEGVGAVLLKPLRRAIEDGDRVHAVILGTALLHTGRTNGYMTPSPPSQARLVSEALADAGVEPSTIGYIEAHGAGTALGDPVEVEGLASAFGDGLPVGSVALGSVKSNIGHTESTAGLTGLTKVVLQLQHGTLVPSLHADVLNPNIAWDSVPFTVQRELAEWPTRPGTPRRAGVSSFGAGGTIGHIVVEGVPAPAPTPATSPRLILLSAYDADRLAELAGRLADHLERVGDAVSLADVAYTLHVGREPLRERLALVVETVAELRDRLRDVQAGRSTDVLRGRAPASVTRPDEVGVPGLLAAGRHWVSGGRVAPPVDGRIVSLPAYPFARVRCWVPEAARPEIPLYERTWTPTDAVVGGPPPAGPYLCLYSPAAQPVAEALARLIQVVPVPEDAVPGVAPEDVAGWIDLCDLGRPSDAPETWPARIALVSRLLTARPGRPLRGVHVTRGLRGPDGPTPDPAGARVGGLVHLLAAEYRHLHTTVLDTDVPPDRPVDLASQILAELPAAGPAEVCYRGTTRYGPTLRVVEAPYAVPRLDPAGCYVVTGAGRGLGALVARHLVEHGARTVVLCGLRSLPVRDEDRDSPELSPAAASAVAGIRALERAGARVIPHAGPLSDRTGIAAVLTDARRYGPIRGVAHCAGTLDSGPTPFIRKDEAALRTAFAAKLDAAELLAELCADDPLAFFLTFSSASAAIPVGAAGVVDYAAANAAMDLFVGARLRRGAACYRSVEWPQWSDSGSGRGQPNRGEQVGIAALSDADGLRVLDRVLALPVGTVVLPVKPLHDGLDVQRLIEVPRAVPAPRIEEARDVTQGPQPWLAELFAGVVGVDAAELDAHADFAELGIESIMLGELLDLIEQRLGRSLEPATLLEYSTLERLGEHLRQYAAPVQVTPVQVTPVQVTPTHAAPVAAPVATPIAVIGMACRFPGAPDIASYWAALSAGRCAVTEVPGTRWDHRRWYDPNPRPGATNGRWGAFVDGIEDFDPDHFGMSDIEATYLDPTIRLFLECVATAVADAGYPMEALAGTETGVFAGGRVTAYPRRGPLRTETVHSDPNFIAAQVAHWFDLRGPNLVVDSACSSSLVSVHLAVQSLRSGEADLALAGGVSILLDHELYLEFTAGRALSPTGRCAAFDESADGFVPGEGCGVVLLKPLPAAIADGDRIHAVIESSAVNNDGRTMGMTTPNPAAQAAVVRRALAAAGRSAREIGLVEGHGTGTAIGDPIELRALTDAFRDSTDQVGQCAIGSVKSNLGHLMHASGVAGLLKVVLATEYGKLPPTLFCDRPNPRFAFADSPFYPCRALLDWPEGPRVAGVSSFGLGGTNAHTIVSAVDPARRGPAAPRRAQPAPRFRRRRLWLDGPSEATPPAAGGNGAAAPLVAPPEPTPAPVPGTADGLVAATLRLRFVTSTSDDAGAGVRR